MRTADVFHLSIIVLITASVVNRFHAARTAPGDQAKRSLFLAVLLLDVSFALGLPQFYWAVFRVLGEVPALPQLIQHVAVIISGFSMAAFIRGVAEPGARTPVWRRRLLITALALLVLFYVAGPLRLELPMLGNSADDDPFLAAYVITWLSYCNSVVVELLLLAWRNRAVSSTWLRIGLRLIGIGCAFALLYTIHKIVHTAAATAHITLPWAENGPDGMQIVLLGPAVACVVVGMVVPSQGPQLVRWHHRRATIRRLTPLVEAVRSVAPGTAWRGNSDSTLRIQVINIRDALIGPLRPYLDAAVHQQAHAEAIESGCREEEAVARAEAACIRAAIRDYGKHLSNPPVPPPMVYADDLDSEARWLAQVSAAYATVSAGTGQRNRAL